MSIEVKGISKMYGAQKALNSIHFSAQKGEIVGLLGPNGAGKTTLMKILTCFLPATEGEATVCGYDVNTESLEIRKKIGYLPEHNPLYREMYVREYLAFIAKVFNVPNPKSRIEELIEQTGLSPEANKKIEFLSKGYRQRVGIAQALMNDPEVLILDEPTSGLDPNQMVEIRALIRNIAKEKLVIFSSHIMDQVEALCSRLIILRNGELVADDAIENISSTINGEKKISVIFKHNIDLSLLKNIASVSRVEQNGNKFFLFCDTNTDIRENVFDLAVAQNNKLLMMQEESSSVSSIFQSITKIES